MKIVKRIILILLCLLLVGVLVLLFGIPFVVRPIQEAYWKDYCFDYVLEHQEELNEYVRQYAPDTPRKRTEYDKFFVVNSATQDKKSHTVRFDVKNGQFGFSSTYIGVFYSPADRPEDFQGLARKGRDAVEKICDHWYWFRTTF